VSLLIRRPFQLTLLFRDTVLSQQNVCVWANHRTIHRLIRPVKFLVYRVSQEERTITWEIIISVTLSKKCICTRICVLFRTVSVVEPFHCTVDKKEILFKWQSWYSLLSIIHFRKFHRQHQMHFATRVRTWRVYSVQCTIQWNSSFSETVRNRTRVHIHFFASNDRYYDLTEYWPFLLGHSV
jgi:hypothetical protein